jgi:serine/threonine protein kinase
MHSRAAMGYAVRDLDRASLKALLANPDSPFHQPGVQVLKDSPSSTVAEWKVPLNGIIRKVIYKKFRITSWTDPLVNGLRLSPALRSWIFGQGLRERCLRTARPLAMFHRRRFGLPWEGYLLTEKIEGALDLSGWLKNLKNLPRLYRFQILNTIIEKVARLIRDLHQRQLSHRDLKAANILVSTGEHRGSRTQDDKFPSGSENGIPAREIDPESSIRDFRVWLIDLVGVMKYRRLPYSRRVQNLGRLNASFVQNTVLSRTDRLRFLRVYLQWGLKGRKGWKKWWKNIEQATRVKVQKNLRNGRVIA